MIAVIDPITDGAILGCIQLLSEPRIAAEGRVSVVSAACELAFADGNGNLDRECDIVGEDAGYLARSSPGLLLAIRNIGDGIGGVVGGAGVICHLRGLEVVLVGRLAVGKNDMFRVAARHDSAARLPRPAGAAVAAAKDALEGVVAGRLRWRDGAGRGSGAQCASESGSDAGEAKKPQHIEEQNLNKECIKLARRRS